MQATKIEILSEVQAAASTTTFVGAVCVATGLERVSETLDKDEGIIACRKVSFSEAIDMIMSGEIINGPSITALMIVNEYLRRKQVVNIRTRRA